MFSCGFADYRGLHAIFLASAGSGSDWRRAHDPPAHDEEAPWREERLTFKGGTYQRSSADPIHQLLLRASRQTPCAQNYGRHLPASSLPFAPKALHMLVLVMLCHMLVFTMP
jgi:hypothetical protein